MVAEVTFTHFCTERRIRSDILTAVMVSLLCWIHAWKLLDISRCQGSGGIEEGELTVGADFTFPCNESFPVKFLAALRNVKPLCIFMCNLKGGERFLVWCLVLILPWLSAAVASMFSRTALRLYASGARVGLLVISKFASKVFTIYVLTTQPDLPPSSYCKWYLPVEGVVLLWQALAAPVGASVQAVIAAADAACTFCCCWLLSDRWPFAHVSPGVVLATNVLLALLSVVVAERVEQRDRRDWQAAVQAQQRQRQRDALHMPKAAQGCSSSGGCDRSKEVADAAGEMVPEKLGRGAADKVMEMASAGRPAGEAASGSAAPVLAQGMQASHVLGPAASVSSPSRTTTVTASPSPAAEPPTASAALAATVAAAATSPSTAVGAPAATVAERLPIASSRAVANKHEGQCHSGCPPCETVAGASESAGAHGPQSSTSRAGVSGRPASSVPALALPPQSPTHEAATAPPNWSLNRTATGPLQSLSPRPSHRLCRRSVDGYPSDPGPEEQMVGVGVRALACATAGGGTAAAATGCVTSSVVAASGTCSPLPLSSSTSLNRPTPSFSTMSASSCGGGYVGGGGGSTYLGDTSCGGAGSHSTAASRPSSRTHPRCGTAQGHAPAGPSSTGTAVAAPSTATDCVAGEPAAGEWTPFGNRAAELALSDVPQAAGSAGAEPDAAWRMAERGLQDPLAETARGAETAPAAAPLPSAALPTATTAVTSGGTMQQLQHLVQALMSGNGCDAAAAPSEIPGLPPAGPTGPATAAADPLSFSGSCSAQLCSYQSHESTAAEGPGGSTREAPSAVSASAVPNGACADGQDGGRSVAADASAAAAGESQCADSLLLTADAVLLTAHDLPAGQERASRPSGQRSAGCQALSADIMPQRGVQRDSGGGQPPQLEPPGSRTTRRQGNPAAVAEDGVEARCLAIVPTAAARGDGIPADNKDVASTPLQPDNAAQPRRGNVVEGRCGARNMTPARTFNTRAGSAAGVPAAGTATAPLPTANAPGGRSPPRLFTLARALVARGGQNAVYGCPALSHIRCSIKLGGLSPADLPHDLAGRLGAALAADGHGYAGGAAGAPPMAAVGVYVREGCIEVVADLMVPENGAAPAAPVMLAAAASAAAAAQPGIAEANPESERLLLTPGAGVGHGHSSWRRQAPEYAAAEAMIALMERSLLPQIQKAVPEPAGAVTMQASFGEVQVASRWPCGGGRLPTAPPPTILLVNPCCVSLTQPSDDDTRDCRRQTVTLTVVLTASAAANASQPLILVRHSGRCLPTVVRPAPPVYEGATAFTIQLPLSGIRPGLLFLEVAAAGGEGEVGELLSAPWPVLVVGDPRVAAEVRQLQQQLDAAAPLRATHAAAAAADLSYMHRSYVQRMQQQPWALQTQLDGGALSLLVDLGMWFDAVSMPEAAVIAAAASGAAAAATPPAALPAARVLASADPPSPLRCAVFGTAESARGEAPLQVSPPPPPLPQRELHAFDVQETVQQEPDDGGSQGSWASSSSCSVPSVPPSPVPSYPASNDGDDVNNGDTQAPPVPSAGACDTAIAADGDVDVNLDGSNEAQLALLRVLQPSAELLEGSLDCAAEYEQLCRRGPALQSAACGLGLRLLRFTVTRGWPAAATLVLRGLLVHCRLSLADILELFPGSSANSGPGELCGSGGGMPLLHTAVMSGRLAMVRAVVSWGQRARMPLRWDEPALGAAGAGLTPLHLAAVLDDSGRLAGDIVGLWPEAEAHWAVARDADGRTPLEYAFVRAMSAGPGGAGGSSSVAQAAGVGPPAPEYAPAATDACAVAGTAAGSGAPVILFSLPPERGGAVRSGSGSSWRGQLTQSLPQFPSGPLQHADLPPYPQLSLLVSQASTAITDATGARSEGPGSGLGGVHPESGLRAAASCHAGGFCRFDRSSECDCGSLSVGPDSQWSHSTTITAQTHYQYQELRSASPAIRSDADALAASLLSFANLPDAVCSRRGTMASGSGCELPRAFTAAAVLAAPTALSTPSESQARTLPRQSSERVAQPTPAVHGQALSIPRHGGPLVRSNMEPTLSPPLPLPPQQQQGQQQNRPVGPHGAAPAGGNDGHADAAACTPPATGGPAPGTPLVSVLSARSGSPLGPAARAQPSTGFLRQPPLAGLGPHAAPQRVVSRAVTGMAPAAGGVIDVRHRASAVPGCASTEARCEAAPEGQSWYEQQAGWHDCCSNGVLVSAAVAAAMVPRTSPAGGPVALGGSVAMPPVPASRAETGIPGAAAHTSVPPQLLPSAQLWAAAMSPQQASTLSGSLAAATSLSVQADKATLVRAEGQMPGLAAPAAASGVAGMDPATRPCRVLAPFAPDAGTAASRGPSPSPSGASGSSETPDTSMPLNSALSVSSTVSPFALSSAATGGSAAGSTRRRHQLADGRFSANSRRFAYADDYAPLCQSSVGARTSELDRLLSLAMAPPPAATQGRGKGQACSGLGKAQAAPLRVAPAAALPVMESAGTSDIDVPLTACPITSAAQMPATVTALPDQMQVAAEVLAPQAPVAGVVSQHDSLKTDSTPEVSVAAKAVPISAQSNGTMCDEIPLPHVKQQQEQQRQLQRPPATVPPGLDWQLLLFPPVLLLALLPPALLKLV